MSRSDEFFLSARQCETLTRFAHITRRDVFYDLGCGDGQAVCTAITKGHVSKAIGVELDKNNYRHAWSKAISCLSKPQLKRVDFWLGRIRPDQKIRAPVDTLAARSDEKETAGAQKIGGVEEVYIGSKLFCLQIISNPHCRSLEVGIKQMLVFAHPRPTGTKRKSNSVRTKSFSLSGMRKERKKCQIRCAKIEVESLDRL